MCIRDRRDTTSSWLSANAISGARHSAAASSTAIAMSTSWRRRQGTQLAVHSRQTSAPGCGRNLCCRTSRPRLVSTHKFVVGVVVGCSRSAAVVGCGGRLRWWASWSAAGRSPPTGRMVTVVTVHTAPVVLPICAGPIVDGAVAVEGERIAAVGPRADLQAAYPAAKGRRWPGILTPGLVNAHAHLQYTDFADLATSGLPFPRWIVTLSARRQTFDDTAWQASARRGIHLALTTGTTCLADVVTNPAVLRPTARSGLAGVSYVEAVAADDRIWSEHARATLLHALDTAPAGRAIGVSPHTLYTLGTAVYADCLAIARKRGLRLHTHLAETAEEVEYVLAGGGALARAVGRMGWE